MGIIIQKFGGTSVATDEARSQLVSKVKKTKEEGNQVVLVVSAMGRKGAPYATDTLLQKLQEYDINPDQMTSDLLVSCCETISASLISALLRAEGLPSVPMTAYTAGIRAQGPYGDAFPTEVDAKAIEKHLKNNCTPVITGFQAINDSNNIITLGRGGSDTSAVAVGIGLKADYIDIYTDVPGVAKVDPRLVDKADFIKFLDYDSMFRLAQHGARVLHHRSATLAKVGKAILRIRSTFDDGAGTVIGPIDYTGKEGRYYAAPDFIGIASTPIDDKNEKFSAIFATGKGKKGIECVSQFALDFGLPFLSKDDSDIISYVCNKNEVKQMIPKMYSSLKLL